MTIIDVFGFFVGFAIGWGLMAWLVIPYLNRWRERTKRK